MRDSKDPTGPVVIDPRRGWPHLSEATVKGYVSRMLDKLGLANSTQAGLLAHDAGLAVG